MDFQTLKAELANSDATQLAFALESGRELSPHFHVTEVGRITKDFVDCGGVRRSAETCVLQTLVANDVDHRLAPGKLLDILEKSAALGIEGSTEVEVEAQGQTIETYAIAQTKKRSNVLVFHLTPKFTACLAPDKCGIPELAVVSEGCCCGTGTC